MESICPVFKWLGCRVFKWHLKTRPFSIQPLFNHLNTRLIRYSDAHCIIISYDSHYSDFMDKLVLNSSQLLTQLSWTFPFYAVVIISRFWVKYRHYFTPDVSTFLRILDDFEWVCCFSQTFNLRAILLCATQHYAR